jgi:hypothetical protein
MRRRPQPRGRRPERLPSFTGGPRPANPGQQPPRSPPCPARRPTAAAGTPAHTGVPACQRQPVPGGTNHCVPKAHKPPCARRHTKPSTYRRHASSPCARRHITHRARKLANPAMRPGTRTGPPGPPWAGPLAARAPARPPRCPDVGEVLPMVRVAPAVRRASCLPQGPVVPAVRGYCLPYGAGSCLPCTGTAARHGSCRTACLASCRTAWVTPCPQDAVSARDGACPARCSPGGCCPAPAARCCPAPVTHCPVGRPPASPADTGLQRPPSRKPRRLASTSGACGLSISEPGHAHAELQKVSR